MKYILKMKKKCVILQNVYSSTDITAKCNNSDKMQCIPLIANGSSKLKACKYK